MTGNGVARHFFFSLTPPKVATSVADNYTGREEDLVRSASSHQPLGHVHTMFRFMLVIAPRALYRNLRRVIVPVQADEVSATCHRRTQRAAQRRRPRGNCPSAMLNVKRCLPGNMLSRKCLLKRCGDRCGPKNFRTFYRRSIKNAAEIAPHSTEHERSMFRGCRVRVNATLRNNKSFSLSNGKFRHHHGLAMLARLLSNANVRQLPYLHPYRGLLTAVANDSRTARI